MAWHRQQELFLRASCCNVLHHGKHQSTFDASIFEVVLGPVSGVIASLWGHFHSQHSLVGHLPEPHVSLLFFFAAPRLLFPVPPLCASLAAQGAWLLTRTDEVGLCCLALPRITRSSSHPPILASFGRNKSSTRLWEQRPTRADPRAKSKAPRTVAAAPPDTAAGSDQNEHDRATSQDF